MISSPSVISILRWFGVLSTLIFILSLVCIPFLILRLPAGVFVQPGVTLFTRVADRSFFSILLFFLRNIIGGLLLLAGILMLVLPGQGLLTMVLGLAMMEFPGKHYLLKTILRLGPVQHSLNWIRKKGGQVAFDFPS